MNLEVVIMNQKIFGRHKILHQTLGPNIDFEYLPDEEQNRCWKFFDSFHCITIYPRHKKQLSIEICLLSCMFRESMQQYLRQESLKKSKSNS